MALSPVEAALRGPGGVAGFLAMCAEAGVTPDEILRDWRYVARPEQREPSGIWDTWLILAGRGFGKTRTGAETMTDWARRGVAKRMAFVAATAADARDVMVEGESGVIAVGERQGFTPDYEPSKRRLTWPNGAMATLYTAEEPTRLRGPQHDGAWCDELPYWRDAQACWDQLQFGLRLGQRPRAVVTCTPRPTALVRALIKDPRVRVTKGTTYDNAANLAAPFMAAVTRAYEGTRLGRQELNAEILDDNPGALFKQAQIDALRVTALPTTLTRVVVAVDPAVSANEDSDQTGIVCAAIAPCWSLPACQGAVHGFVMDDVSGIYTPAEWATLTAEVYGRRRADLVVGEVNNGGDLVEANLRGSGNANLNYKAVHASRGKAIRAEPISGLYEQGKAHHVGIHPKLEDEQTQWDPQAGMRSPSRLDALVWALTELMLEDSAPGYRPPRAAPANQRRI